MLFGELFLLKFIFVTLKHTKPLIFTPKRYNKIPALRYKGVPPPPGVTCVWQKEVGMKPSVSLLLTLWNLCSIQCTMCTKFRKNWNLNNYVQNASKWKCSLLLGRLKESLHDKKAKWFLHWNSHRKVIIFNQ